jgi:hypothetical protein
MRDMRNFRRRDDQMKGALEARSEPVLGFTGAFFTFADIAIRFPAMSSKIPCIFPVNREFRPETGSLMSPRTTTAVPNADSGLGLDLDYARSDWRTGQVDLLFHDLPRQV